MSLAFELIFLYLRINLILVSSSGGSWWAWNTTRKKEILWFFICLYSYRSPLSDWHCPCQARAWLPGQRCHWGPMQVSGKKSHCILKLNSSCITGRGIIWKTHNHKYLLLAQPFFVINYLYAFLVEMVYWAKKCLGVLFKTKLGGIWQEYLW